MELKGTSARLLSSSDFRACIISKKMQVRSRLQWYSTRKRKGKSRKHIGACGNREDSQKYYQQKGHVIQNL